MSGSRYQEQGPGDLVPGRGIELIERLEARDGQLTLLQLADGRTLRSFNIAYGRDFGDEWEHLTLNISPRIDGEFIDWISTGDVVAAVDPETSEFVYRRSEA